MEDSKTLFCFWKFPLARENVHQNLCENRNLFAANLILILILI